MKIRSLFKAPEGRTFITMDLSQAENWITAFSANEPNMKDALLNGDIHTRTAAAIFEIPEDKVTKEQRYVGKRLNHALSYRMSGEQLFRVFNKDSQGTGTVISLAQAKLYREKWHGFYRIKSWWSEIEAKLATDRTITTVYGRRRIFYGRWGDSLFKEATAFIPQSTVADHAYGCQQEDVNEFGGIAGINIDCRSKKDFRLVHSAHDSVMLEVPKDQLHNAYDILLKNFKRPLMINGEVFTIPVDCEVGESWGELKKWNPNGIQT